MKKLLLLPAIFISPFFFLSASVIPLLADETTVEIVANGSESNNEVVVESTIDTNVSQNNDAVVKTVVTQSANTGDNQANQNTGGNVTIDTGSVETITTITTTTINHNQVDTCCDTTSGTTTTITNNGAASANTATVTAASANTVTQTNHADINNNPSQSADTGANQANQNTGNSTTIHTGDINATATITNQNINHNTAHVPAAAIGGPQHLTISGNGAGSTNQANIELVTNTDANQEQDFNIDNLIDQIFNTGTNQANQNTGGSVNIITGTIIADATIINQDININNLDLCCQETNGDDDNGDEDNGNGNDNGNGDSNGNNNGNNNGNGNDTYNCECNCDCDCDYSNDCNACCSDCCYDCCGAYGGITERIIEKTTEYITYRTLGASSGIGGGQVLGATLPATGSSAANTIYFLIANILTFLLGTYLRLRSGRSPSTIS